MAESKGSSTQSPQKQTAANPRQSQRSLQPRHADQGLGFPDLFSTSPFQLMRRMTEDLDRAWDRMFTGAGSARETMWSPRIEAFQKGDQFIVRAELPGLKKDDVEVNVTEDAITIQGQRQEEHEDRREGFYHSERSYGSFYRTIPLPAGVITDSADASFRDGMLEVRLQAPPNEVSRGRRLEIKQGSPENERK